MVTELVVTKVEDSVSELGSFQSLTSDNFKRLMQRNWTPIFAAGVLIVGLAALVMRCIFSIKFFKQESSTHTLGTTTHTLVGRLSVSSLSYFLDGLPTHPRIDALGNAFDHNTHPRIRQPCFPFLSGGELCILI